MSDIKNTSLNLVKEMGSIIAAVLIALAIGTWWEDREKDQLQRELTLRIYAELKENLEGLKASFAHHSAHLEKVKIFRKKFTEPSEADFKALYYEIYRESIFKPARLTRTNWEAAKYVEAVSRMDVETLSDFSRVYSFYDIYHQRWTTIMNGETMVNLLASTQKDRTDYIITSINDAWWLEKGAIIILEKALEGH